MLESGQVNGESENWNAKLQFFEKLKTLLAKD